MLGMARQRIFGLYRRQIGGEPCGIAVVSDATRMALHSAGGGHCSGHDILAHGLDQIFPSHRGEGGAGPEAGPSGGEENI